MFESYSIKTINNEQILFLNIDLSNEFSFKNLKHNIKKYLKKHKILFTGSIIALVINGQVIGNYKLNNETNNNNNRTISLVELLSIPNIPNNIEEIKVDKGETNVIKKEEKVKVVKKTTTITTKNNEQETLYVTLKRKDNSVINIELEEYLIGVVAAEMPAEFNIEALKAQSIIARTYAMKYIKNNKILTNDEKTQSYKDNNELKNMWDTSYNKYYNKIKEAVEATKGMYLTYDNDLIEAVYHSTSNGYTEDASEVWNNSYPYLISVKSEYDPTNKNFYQEKTITYEELSRKLKIDINYDTIFNIIEKTKSNRVKTIIINNLSFSGIEIRSLLGLRSTDFDIEKTADSVVFKTKGYGHGVGLSQYGANGMAKNGYNYKEILSHYYPSTTISK